MKPQEIVEEYDQSGLATSSLDDTDGHDSGNFFDIENFHKSLAPPMTRELEEKISKKVQEAFSANRS
jgi:hypothetical protein